MDKCCGSVGAPDKSYRNIPSSQGTNVSPHQSQAEQQNLGTAGALL